MKPSRVEMESGGALLFVRRLSDLPPVLRTVNSLLSRRRSSGAEGDAVMGIVVGADLDARLTEAAAGPADTDVHLRESVGLSRIWSLCWFDTGLAQEDQNAGERRRRLVDSLVRADPPRGGRDDEPVSRRVILPVLTRSEAGTDSGALTTALQARYPTLAIMPNSFVQDAAGGGLVRLENADAAPKVVGLS